ncbi:unnamed protein product [Cunninghamella echinulata]
MNTTPTIPVFSSSHIQKSLLDLFIQMPSPKQTELEKINPIAQEILNDIMNKNYLTGMKTQLYHYQKASLWKLVQRELAPQKCMPPIITELISVDNIKYYINQITNGCVVDKPMIDDVCGGVICEDMGTGKTCVCLSAIMVTKQILKTIENVELTTDMINQYQDQTQPYKVKSLKTIATEQMLLQRIPWKNHKYNLPSDIHVQLEKYPPYYEWQEQDTSFPLIKRQHRGSLRVTTLKIYPSSATLTIVPDNLVAQWMGEIYKHIMDDQIDFIVLDDNKKSIPHPTLLVHSDLVLISQSRFSYEYSYGGLEFQGIPRQCDCAYIDNVLVKNPLCQAIHPKPKYVSPLLQVHWKRVIVDEGHSLSSRNSRHSSLAAKLFSCWFWVCTGTPSSNLTEVAISRSHQEELDEDLTRLGVIFGEILKLPPFNYYKYLWNRLIVKPFMKQQPWSVYNLNNLMCRIMIRNQKKDIEHDVTLPPLYTKTVLLDFDYYQWLAHNCQISLISLNAILSKREGPDYLFSKKNVKSLRETVSNMRQSCTWHSIDIPSLKSSYSNCIEKLKQVDEGKENYGAEDELGLRQIKDLFEMALNDTVFMDMMTKHEVSFVVQGLPKLFREQWGWSQGDYGAYLPMCDNDNGHNDNKNNNHSIQNPWNDHCVISGDILVDLVHYLTDSKMQDDRMGIYVYDSESSTIESTELYEKSKQFIEKIIMKDNNKKKNKQVATKQWDRITSNIIRKKIYQLVHEKEALSSSPSSSISVTKSLNIPLDQLEMDEEETNYVREKLNDATGMTFYTRNVFKEVQVLCSSSSKINYLVDQILTYHSNEKCIIFSQYYNEMQEIYLALKLVKVRTLMYLESSMTNNQRSQTIITFNTSENANVMIMAVQKAAYGIDLSSATRVYFVSPVWQSAMEQQAIKRAHRIGQKNPVYVEILVIRNSIEDALLKRRNTITEHDNTKADFYNDKRLQNILNHANFVPKPNHIIQLKNKKYQQKIIKLNKPISVISQPMKRPIIKLTTMDDHDDDNHDNDNHEDAPKKKKKISKVTFQ